MSSYTEQINDLERQITNNNNTINSLTFDIEIKRRGLKRRSVSSNDEIMEEIRVLERQITELQIENNKLNKKLEDLRNEEDNELRTKQQQPVEQLTLEDLDKMIVNKLNEIKIETDKDKLGKLNEELKNLRIRQANMKGGYNPNINYKNLYLKYKSKYLGLKNKN